MIPAMVLAGLCEGSGLVGDPADPASLLAADNEVADHLVRIGVDGAPGGTVPLAQRVEDLEALASDGESVWAVGSFSHGKSGKAHPERARIVQLRGGGTRVWSVDWSGCAACADPDAPHDAAASLNVEGAAWWAGHLWLGLRAPLGDGARAWLVELTPIELVDRFEVRAFPVDLGGLGVRDLAVQPGKPERLYILAGASQGNTVSALYTLDAPGAAPVRAPLALPEGAEGLVVRAEGSLRAVTDGAAGPDGTCRTASVLYRADKL